MGFGVLKTKNQKVKMQKINYFKNSIGLAIIVSLLMAPIFYARQAQAENFIGTGVISDGTTPGKYTATGVGGAAVLNSMGSVLPAVMSLPGCKSAVKDLFSKKISGLTNLEKDTAAASYDGAADFKGTTNYSPNAASNAAWQESQDMINSTSGGPGAFLDKILSPFKPNIALAQNIGGGSDAGVTLNPTGSSGTDYGSWSGSGSTTPPPATPATDTYLMDSNQMNPTVEIPSPANLSDKVESFTNGLNSVPVNDVNLQKKVDTIDKNTKTTAEGIAAMETNQNCWNAIGKIVAKKLLQEVTLSTVKWIQSGYNGKPFFVQDPINFFNDIAKHEILTFGAEISDPVKYPYGKAFLQNMALNYNQRFQDNAAYSLDEMIAKTTPQYSASSFKDDFSQGGWNAWDAMTQVPANNPLGFQMIASEELSQRLAGTSQSNAQNMRDALQQSNGFLGDQKCVDPKTGRLNGITKEEDNFAIKLGEFYKNDSTSIVGGQDEALIAKYGTSPRHCLQWQYVTPGKTIADWATKTLGNSDKSLIDVNTFNDAIAAILDAAVAQFSGQLTQKGLAYMSTNENDYHYNSGSFSTKTGVTSDFTESQINDSTWLTQNSSFNIRTDVNQALIDTQRTYLQKIKDENTYLSDLIKNIWQLDYCIPGPNPNWEDISQTTMENVIIGKTPDKQTDLLIETNTAVNGTTLGHVGQNATQAIVSTLLKKAPKILQNIPIVSIVGGILDIFASKDADEKNRQDMARYITAFLKVWVNDSRGGGNQDEIHNMGEVQDFFTGTFDSYKNIIKRTYFTPSDESDKYMPTVTFEARAEFKKVEGYQQIIINNGKTITAVEGTITKLQGIKDDLDKLNLRLASGSINQDDYNSELLPIKNSFARLSISIFSGDDVASVDSLSKQAKDEKTYVHDDLLMGKYGCEKSMEKLWKTDPNTYGKYVRRQPYPLEIDHIYQPADVAIGQNVDPYDPANYKPWNQTSINDILNHVVPGTSNGREGFLFGALYYNAIAGPWSDTGDLPAHECPPYYIDTLFTPPLNGFNTSRSQPRTDVINECGSVTRGLEQSFGVY